MTTIRAVRREELDEMCELIATAYAGRVRDAAAVRLALEAEGGPAFNLELNRVLEIDGRLAARIAIINREMYFHGGVLRVGGIGGVCTDPAHRGKGLCKLLLDDCTNVMKKMGFDVSLLYGLAACQAGH